MGEQNKTLERFKAQLLKQVEKGEVLCPKCGNKELFIVNEIGHVYCSKCHTKIPFMKIK